MFLIKKCFKYIPSYDNMYYILLNTTSHSQKICNFYIQLIMFTIPASDEFRVKMASVLHQQQWMDAIVCASMIKHDLTDRYLTKYVQVGWMVHL